MNPFDSTDICRDQQERIDPAHTKHLLSMVLTGIGIGMLIVFGSLLLLLNFANEIDDFFNSKAGALTIISVCGTFGVWRFMVIVKNW